MALPDNWNLTDLLTLTYFKKVNITAIRKAVENFSTIDELMNSEDSFATHNLFKQQSLFENDSKVYKNEAIKQLEKCKENSVNIVTIWDEDYPELLKEIDIPPIMIFVKGRLQKSDAASISMVGTRKCSTYGSLIAERFAEYFAMNDIIVTSGLAHGIDTISHLSAVKKSGITYAVLGSAIDCISPAMSLKNSEKIIDAGGAIISEYKCGTSARPGYFPQRNRIISGISKATVVIESGKKGGSLITAKFAMDQGREVFAVPGDIRYAKSKGTNLLLKRNIAAPALSPEDILDELGFNKLISETNDSQQIMKLGEVEKNIYSVLSYEPMQIDEIAEKADCEITELMVKLLIMEFNNVVKQLPGKYYIRAN